MYTYIAAASLKLLISKSLVAVTYKELCDIFILMIIYIYIKIDINHLNYYMHTYKFLI